MGVPDSRLVPLQVSNSHMPLTADDLLARQVLRHLFFAGDPHAWRLRQVTQITPLTTDSYRAQTSYQFRFGKGLIETAWRDAAGSTLDGATPLRPDGDPELIIPVDYLPKSVLLDFSLTDSGGKPLTLLHSREISETTFEVFRFGFTFLDGKCEDGLTTAGDFFSAHADMIWPIVASGQQEITERLDRLNCFPTATPSEHDYCAAMMRYFSDAIQQLVGRTLSKDECNACWARLKIIFAEIGRMGDELATLVGAGNGYRNPIFNIALLFSDYSRTRADLRDATELVMCDFLDKSQAFTHALLELTNDEKRFPSVLLILQRIARDYVAYTRLRVPIDRDFVVKMDQVVPAGEEPFSSWLHPIRRWRHRHYQWYPFRIGDSRSTHIEISCAHPAELEQVPGKTRVRVWERIVDTSVVFGRSSHETKYYQHFYTARTGEQIQQRLGLPGEKQMLDLHLGVRFAVERSLLWGYWLIAGVMIVAAIFLVAVYDPESMRKRQTSFLPVVPILFALFGALSALRTQEGIVATRVMKYKISVIVLGALMALYVLVGVLYSPAIAWLRALIEQSPLAGLLL